MPGMYIELKDLQLYGQHGWHAQEALTGNEFLLNITVHFVPLVAVIKAIEETISYADIYSIAKEEFKVPQQLLETSAMQIAEKLHQHFPQITGVQISIYKLTAPIPNFTGKVGITYHKVFDVPA